LRGEGGQISFSLFNKAQEASQYPSVDFSDGPLTEEAFKLLNSQSLLAFLGQQLHDMDNENVCELLRLLLPMGSRLAEQTRFDLFPESRRVRKICCPLIPPDKVIDQSSGFCGCNIILELQEHLFWEVFRTRCGSDEVLQCNDEFLNLICLESPLSYAIPGRNAGKVARKLYPLLSAGSCGG
jgi:hypothetical protein